MDNKNWRFCVSGNVVKTHNDENGILRYGTKAFAGGTKIYLAGKYWDESRTDIGVIGQNRFGRYVVEGVPLELIENIRFQRVYKPVVLEIMDYLEVMDGWEWWKRTAEDRREAIAFAEMMSERIKSIG